VQTDHFAQFSQSDPVSMPCDLLKDGEGATERLYGDALAVHRTMIAKV
jgi:hypothetical protein